MPEEEKPYRLYRGGRVKGKVPAPPRPTRPGRAGGDGRRYPGPGPLPRRRRLTWQRGLLLGVIVFLVVFALWAAASYFSFRGGVEDANKRLDSSTPALLQHQGGLLFSHPTTVLLLGTDHSKVGGREADRHSDSIMLVRIDPKHHRIAYLSIPRDLLVEVPGHGQMKINGAFQLGGPPLALKTIRLFTGLQVNHVVIVDFASFKDLIDELGGITVDVPAPIRSNRFDCPFSAARCASWKGWRFAKGKQHMNGTRALVYSRIRENQLNPSESDVTRGERQQHVLQAIAGKLTSFGTLVKLPFVGGDLLKPLTTDLSAGQFLQLGWVKFRAPAGRALHCRLGGEPSSVGGASVIEPSEDNREVISMVLGLSAPQPPRPGSGLYGPGCTIGNAALR